MKASKRTLQWMSNKVSNHPTPFIVDVQPFPGGKLEYQRFRNLDNMYPSIRRFLGI